MTLTVSAMLRVLNVDDVAVLDWTNRTGNEGRDKTDSDNTDVGDGDNNIKLTATGKFHA